MIVYFVFPLLPLGIFFYCYINNKEGFISQKKIFSLFYYIGLIQFPILLLQMNFYDFFIQFNNSGQTIDWYDFMFGSFFIKSDHSLGVFLLLLIAIILLKKDHVQSIVMFPKIVIAYLGITIFLTESNISKLFLVILISSYVMIPLYKKHGKSLKFKLGIVFLSITLLFSGYLLKDKEFIQKRLGGTLERQISIEAAEKFYELGTAKRFQIIIVAVKKLETKWIGDGPYSYFNILTGEFKKTQHFTQLIWTYFDLGILGLIVVLCLMRYFIRYLDVDKGLPTLFFFGVFFVYSFYVPIFSDIAIIFSMFFIFSRKQTNYVKATKLD
ncbi:hypothetical protein [Aquimarina algiphila]|uniref:hypothetical protein n=1 Tax=Aquimarina algiphila TaxID=2047982 RepID=UPI00232E0C16|nr:hypothetical protein [Aquimarina algiphila]